MTKAQKVILWVMAAILAVMTFAVIYLAAAGKRPVVRGEFVPPEFEAAAVAGIPSGMDAASCYSRLVLNEDTAVSMCANLYIENSSALVFLTADARNAGWIRIKILDAGGSVLGQSGLLRPGEYVRALALDRIPEAGTMLTVKILIYEPDTYLSLGSANAQVRVAG